MGWLSHRISQAFDILREQLNQIFWMGPKLIAGMPPLSTPMLITRIQISTCPTGKVSLDRLNDFLHDVILSVPYDPGIRC